MGFAAAAVTLSVLGYSRFRSLCFFDPVPCPYLALPQLADFGCALVLKDDNNGDGVEMSMKGTPLFMAPEMLLKRKCGRRVDVWSLGCAVVEMVTTRPPWADAFKHPIEIIEHFNENPGPPPLPAELPSPLQHFLLSCFTWDPEVRPSAQELSNHPYLQQRSVPGEADAANSADDVPLEEMDRVSAVTRMRRCSSATLDLLAVQARQAALGVGIGSGAAPFGSAPATGFRPPSPRYAPPGLAHTKRTPTRRRMYGSVGVSEGGPTPVAEAVAAAAAKVSRAYAQEAGGASGAPSTVTAGTATAAAAPADDRPRRNSLPLSRSPPMSPDKAAEVERPRTYESRRPGRGAGVGHFEDEERASGPIISTRVRGPVPGAGDRCSSGGSASTRSTVSNEGAHADAGGTASFGAAGTVVLTPALSINGRRIPTPLSTPRGCDVAADSAGGAQPSVAGTGALMISAGVRRIPTPLSTPRGHELVGVTLVGGAGVAADPSPASDTPPPMVRPLEIRSSSARAGDVSWVPEVPEMWFRTRSRGVEETPGGCGAR